MSFVKAVAQRIGRNLNDYKVIVVKSILPIGTGTMVADMIKTHTLAEINFDVVSNPDFLREGSAVDDCLKTDRIVVLCGSERAEQVLRCVYKTLIDEGVAFLATDVKTSEAIKYAANGMLVLKIAYINELARLRDATGADVLTVSDAMGLDNHISPHSLQPDPGFDGSCFLKDVWRLCVQPLSLILSKNSTSSDKLYRCSMGDVAGKTVALFGLALKANTDDVRYASSITIINELKTRGAIIKVYDPAAAKNMQRLFPDLDCYSSVYQAIEDADCAVVVTEWTDIQLMDLQRVASLMRQKKRVDARNIIDREKLSQLDFDYYMVGWA